MQQKGIWLVNLFLSRQKFHAKQIFVLSSSMKLGPVPHFDGELALHCVCDVLFYSKLGLFLPPWLGCMLNRDLSHENGT